MVDSEKQKTLFDPDVAFLNLTIVQCTFGIIIVAALVICFAIWTSIPMEPAFTHGGFVYFVETFKIPLGLLATIIPFIALLAANHRSEQTKKQMELTRSQIARTDEQIRIADGQNRFSNYFKHLEEFTKRYEKFAFDRYTIIDARVTHRAIFPDAQNGKFALSEAILESLNNEVIGFIADIFLYRLSGQWNKASKQIIARSERLSTAYGISIRDQSGIRIPDKDGNFLFPATTMQSFLLTQLNMLSVIEDLFAFDTEYVKNRNIAELRTLNPYLPKYEVASGQDSFDIRRFLTNDSALNDVFRSLERMYEYRDELAMESGQHSIQSLGMRPHPAIATFNSGA